MQGNGNATGGLGTTMQAPATAMDEPATTMQALATTMEGSGMTMQAPASAMQAPARPSRRRLTGYRADASIAQRLVSAQIAIDAVLADAALQEAMAAYGYDATRMLQGQALREQALGLVQQQRARLGAQFAATDARARSQAQAHAIYMRHVGVARVALRGDRGAAEALDLAARKRSKSGWLLQAQQFYANLLGDPAIVAKLAGFGLAQEQIAAGQQLVTFVAAGDVAQQSRKSIAQETMKARDAALDALNDWMRDFLAIAQIALAEQPQALERLGIIVAA
jgi:hypothetical protein